MNESYDVIRELLAENRAQRETIGQMREELYRLIGYHDGREDAVPCRKLEDLLDRLAES